MAIKWMCVYFLMNLIHEKLFGWHLRWLTYLSCSCGFVKESFCDSRSSGVRQDRGRLHYNCHRSPSHSWNVSSNGHLLLHRNEENACTIPRSHTRIQNVTQHVHIVPLWSVEASALNHWRRWLRWPQWALRDSAVHWIASSVDFYCYFTMP